MRIRTALLIVVGLVVAVVVIGGVVLFNLDFNVSRNRLRRKQKRRPGAS
jgi:hypothetical protein